MENLKKRILCVDDDEDTCEMFSTLFSLEGYETIYSRTSATALVLAASQTFDLIILDWMLPDLSGIELCEKLTAARVKAQILFYTGYADVSAEDAIKAGASVVLLKPAETNSLLAIVACLMAN